MTILGIVQIPLGLTLYGSPESLFILYAIGAFILLALFFILSYLYDPEERRLESDYDSRGSYISGPSVVEDRHHSNLGRAAAAGAAGAGLAALFRRRSRSRSRTHVYDDSHTSYIDEKYSDEPRRSGWGKRLLELGAIVGGVGLAKRLFDKRRDRESDTESGRYRPAHARSDDVTDDSLSRVEEGRPEPSHRPPRDRPPSRPPSQGSMDYSSDYYTDNEERSNHGVRDTILGAGIFAGIRNLFKGRKASEEQRVDDIRRRDAEEERLARANSKRKYTGDGHFPRRNRRTSSYYTPTEVTSTDITRPAHSHVQGESTLSGQRIPSGGVDQPLSDIPPVPPTHAETPVSYGDGHHDHTIGSETEDVLAGVASGIASSHHHRRRSSSRRRDEQVSSPPVSVKVKMHNDGRHVTLRRLTEEEAAASREARRRERERRGSRRRHGSVSSLSGNEGDSDRWRRVEELERQQAEEVRREQHAAASAAASAAAGTSAAGASTAHPAPSVSIPPSTSAPAPHPSDIHIPPAPPSSLPYGAGSITSPGTWTGTEASGDYASNRRRRRAERAQARQARQHSVEFT